MCIYIYIYTLYTCTYIYIYIVIHNILYYIMAPGPASSGGAGWRSPTEPYVITL